MIGNYSLSSIIGNYRQRLKISDGFACLAQIVTYLQIKYTT